jgi:hypothetical protein
LNIDTEVDSVIEVKEKILEHLGLKKKNDGSGNGINSTNPYMKKIRLFSLKGGIELMDFDLMESILFIW